MIHKYRLTLRIAANTDKLHLRTYPICSDQDKFSSTITSKYLTDLWAEEHCHSSKTAWKITDDDNAS